jgi:hypothetical protein
MDFIVGLWLGFLITFLFFYGFKKNEKEYNYDVLIRRLLKYELEARKNINERELNEFNKRIC